jgi:hypothetical protein
MTKRAEFLIKGRWRLAEPFHYTASGLNNVFLLNGFTIKDRRQLRKRKDG